MQKTKVTWPPSGELVLYCIVFTVSAFLLLSKRSPLHLSEILGPWPPEKRVSALHNLGCVITYFVLAWKIKRDGLSCGISAQSLFALCICEVGTLCYNSRLSIWELKSIAAAVICTLVVLRYQSSQDVENDSFGRLPISWVLDQKVWCQKISHAQKMRAECEGNPGQYDKIWGLRDTMHASKVSAWRVLDGTTNGNLDIRPHTAAVHVSTSMAS